MDDRAVRIREVLDEHWKALSGCVLSINAVQTPEAVILLTRELRVELFALHQLLGTITGDVQREQEDTPAVGAV